MHIKRGRRPILCTLLTKDVVKAPVVRAGLAVRAVQAGRAGFKLLPMYRLFIISNIVIFFFEKHTIIPKPNYLLSLNFELSDFSHAIPNYIYDFQNFCFRSVSRARMIMLSIRPAIYKENQLKRRKRARTSSRESLRNNNARTIKDGGRVA
jgi:hypothetical protein